MYCFTPSARDIVHVHGPSYVDSWQAAPGHLAISGPRMDRESYGPPAHDADALAVQG